VNEKTAFLIRDSLLNYRGEEELKNWDDRTIEMRTAWYEELINASNMGELQGYAMMISDLLGNSPEIISIEEVYGNDFDPTDGKIITRGSVEKQLDWLAKLSDMGPNDFSIVGFANDHDGVLPVITWMVYKNENGATTWEPLGVNNRVFKYVQKFGLFANKDEDGNPLIQEDLLEDSGWLKKRFVQFMEYMTHNTGVLAFAVDFKGPIYSGLFLGSLNWKEWPEVLLSE